MTDDDFGSLSWGRRTRGLLTPRERLALQPPMLREVGILLRSQAALLARLPRGSAHADLTCLATPDSDLARAVEAVAVARQSPPMLAHTRRTVAFAHAIAELDGLAVDPELLWCACLLHDAGLEHRVAGECFAVRGGELAEQTALAAGADRATAAALGDAISRHASPGLDRRRHPVAYLVSTGALADIIGRRLERMDPDFVADLMRAQPRTGFVDAVTRAWTAEAHAVRGGRADLTQRNGFSLVARIARVR